MKVRTPALIGLLALVLGMAPGHAGAASPQEFALTAIERVSPAVSEIDDTVELTYTTDGPADADWIAFGYTDRIEGQFNVYGEEGSASRFVEGYEPAGAHRLDVVYLGFDDGDDWIGLYYWRDGTIDYYSDYEAEPTHGTHSLEFSALDFSVVNLGEDVTSPSVDSFQADRQEGLTPGDELRIDFEASDVGSSVQSIHFTYRAPGGRDRHLSTYASWTTGEMDGFVTKKITKGWAGGTYELTEIEVWDAAGIRATHLRDGTIAKYPTKAYGPDVHPLDLSSGDITIDNPDADLTPPQLLSVMQVTESPYFPGEKAVFEYETEEDASGVERVWMSWWGEQWSAQGSDPSDGNFGEEPEDATDGRVEVIMDPWLEHGAYQLRSIAVFDGAENELYYERGGLTYEGWTGIEGTHEIGFESIDFEIVPWPYTFEDDLVGGAPIDGGRGIDIDFESGKFRFVPMTNWPDTPVYVAMITELDTGGYRAEYAEDGVTFDGIFDPESGAFVARYGEDGEPAWPLAGGPWWLLEGPALGLVGLLNG